MGTMTQDEFIQELLKSRQHILVADPNILNTRLDTVRDKSFFINKLKAMPCDDMAPPVAQSPKKGVNRRAGTCSTCNNPVEANAGYYYLVGSSYHEHHKLGECPLPVATKAPLVPGFYLFSDAIDTDLYVKVKINKNTRRLNAEILTPHGTLQYGAGVLKRLQSGNPVAIDEATFVSVLCLRKYGALPGTKELQDIAMKYAVSQANCIFCDLALTDPRSNPLYGGAGYGPICAKRYNLPWGDNTLTMSTLQTSPSPIAEKNDDYL